ncbi:MAG: hypothetical protein LBQ93_11610 [Treponema sp.]|nr:hypothetical protein [Treponema sp.]
MDYVLKSVDYTLKSMDYDSKSVDYDLKFMDYGVKSMDYDLKSVDYGLKSIPETTCVNARFPGAIALPPLRNKLQTCSGSFAKKLDYLQVVLHRANSGFLPVFTTQAA